MPTIADIAAALDLPFKGDGDRQLIGVAALETAGPAEVSFVTSDAYAKAFAATRAGVVLVQSRAKLPARPAAAAQPVIFPVEDAELALSKVLTLFAPPVPHPAVGRDPTARIAPSARLGEGCAIGPFVVVGERSHIGRNCLIHPGVVIGDDVIIGDDCTLYSNVALRERVSIGDRVIIHANSVLGTDGFGYRWDGTKHAKVPQIGTVVIEPDVEIGACVCIDRAKFGETRVGRGTKIDNLVQVAHNVHIGPHCIIVGQVGLAGSVEVGTGVVLGGQAAIRDHVTLGDGAMVAACAAVAEDIDPKAIVSGMPALPHRQSLREQAALRRLPDLVVTVRKLQDELAALKKQLLPKTETTP